MVSVQPYYFAHACASTVSQQQFNIVSFHFLHWVVQFFFFLFLSPVNLGPRRIVGRVDRSRRENNECEKKIINNRTVESIS